MSNYAVSDLHGCYNQWKAIQAFCKENDRIYVLGDCIDRSPEGFDTLKSVMRDPRTTLIRGNHEQMMADALTEERDYGYSDYWMWVWFNNGGKSTYDAWQEDGRKFDWISTINHLPLWAKYTNQEGKEIVMSHSGVVPKKGWGIESCSHKKLLWDRDHLTDKHWHRDENEIIIHGHTTSIHLLENLNILVESDMSNPLIIKYCQGHKIDIDLCAHYTGTCALINLDSLQPIYFNSEGKINETRSLEVDSGVRKLVSSF